MTRSMNQKLIILLQDHAYCALYSFIRDPEQTPFVVSGTFRAPLNERSANNRQPLVKRMIDPLIATHTIYWLAVVFLLEQCIYRRILGIDDNTTPWHTAAVIQLVEVAFAAFVPVRYMIWPPTSDEFGKISAEDRDQSRQADRKYWTRRNGAALIWQDVAEILVIAAYDWW